MNEEIITLHLIYFSLLKILMLGLVLYITLLKSKLIFIEFTIWKIPSQIMLFMCNVDLQKFSAVFWGIFVVVADNADCIEKLFKSNPNIFLILL